MPKQPNTTTAPTGSIAPFGLRMLPELREKVEAAARDSGRSMNAEIVARLAASFEPPALGFGPGSVGDQFERAREEALAKLDDAVPQIADRVMALITERMKIK